MAIKPVTPDEALKLHQGTIPDEMFEAVNELLIKHATKESSPIVFKLFEVSALFVEKSNGKYTSQQAFDNYWFSFEPSYRDAGWDVERDSPGHGEIYPTFYTFSRAKK